MRSGQLTTGIKMKKCFRCKRDLELSEFWKNKRNKDGLQTYCKKCHYSLAGSLLDGDTREKYLEIRRSRHLKSKYNISIEEYERLLHKQGGSCAICDTTLFGKKLAVDHDHETGAIRGLLCGNCNRGLGMFKDNPLYLKQAIKYLKY